MAVIKLVCTRKVESSNLTFGAGRLGALTITGEVYDAEGYSALVVDPIPTKVDLSASLILCTAVISLGGTVKVIEDIQATIADYFDAMAEKGIFQIKVGIIVESRSVSKPVNGIHPVTGAETMNILINNATLLGVEEPEVLAVADDLLDDTTKARAITKENNATGLASYLAKKAGEAGKSLGNDVLNNLLASRKKA